MLRIFIIYYTQHSVDIAYLLSTVNQLRHALELAAPWPRDFLIVLLSLSFVLQVAASALLLTESIMCRKDDYCNRKRYVSSVMSKINDP